MSGYWDIVAPRYDSLYKDGYSLMENRAVKIKLARRLKPGYTVLDVGCGTGLGYDLLPPFVFYYGCDFSTAMLKLARAKYPSLPFEQVNGQSLECYEAGYFDMVMGLFGVFSYFSSPMAALHNARRILKPGGRLFYMAYNRRSLARLIRHSNPPAVERATIRKDNAPLNGPETRFYTAQDLRDMVEVLFTDVTITPLSTFGSALEHAWIWPFDAICSEIGISGHNWIIEGRKR